MFFPSTPGAAGVAGWQATTGVHVRPRLEMQLGFSYTREINNQDPAYQSTSLAGQYLDGSRYNKRQTYSIPVVARYAVARFSRPRLYADAILGLTLLGSEYRFTEERRVDHQVVSGFEDSGRATQLYATAGLGVRCPFGRHFEGVLDWTYSRNFRTVPESVHLAVTGNKYGLTRALSVGLRYRFNLKKPAAAAAP